MVQRQKSVSNLSIVHAWRHLTWTLPPSLLQDTTFNQNLSYTILSWPEEHVQDLLELWRLQFLFLATTVFNILLTALLFFSENPDR